MATVCSDVINVEELNDNWSRMAKELLQQADIKINGSRPWDIQVHHADFFKRVFQQGSLGFGESYMDGWWIATDWMCCSIKFSKANWINRCRET